MFSNKLVKASDIHRSSRMESIVIEFSPPRKSIVVEVERGRGHWPGSSQAQCLTCKNEMSFFELGKRISLSIS